MDSSEATQAVTILNVHDDEGDRCAISRILRLAGFNVKEAASGSEALAMIADEPPYLVLLDVSLPPDMSGFEVCRQIKSDPATSPIPVLQMCATYVQVSDRAPGLEGGADGYLVEPVEPAELVATVNAFVRMRRAEESCRISAREWRSIFDALNDGVALLSLEGIILRANRSFARITGQKVEEICDRHWNSLPVPAEFNPSIDEMRASGQRRSATAELNDRTYQITSDPAVDFAGDISAAVCTVIDVTERVRGEKERTRLLRAEQQARQDAERANRLKDEFLAKVSHELRTPLNSVLGWTSLLRSGRLDAAAGQRALDTIERNARLQSKLIDDLLDASRIVSGRLWIEFRRFELTGAVRGSIEAIQPMASAKDVHTHALIDSGDIMVMGDPSRLEQVLWNLLSNAIKFTPAGGDVTVTVQKAEGAHVQIAVSDTGVGIRRDFLPHVFECFRQQDGSSTRSYGGLGLGLAIAKNLVELHRGTIRVHSEGEGKGTDFTIVLPVAAAEETKGADTIADPESPGNVTGVRILVVDDEPDTRELISTLLGRCGAIVQTAASAQEAVSSLAEFKPDVLVSDIEMPREDGYMLIATLRRLEGERGRRIPALALTAHASAEDRERVLLSGFQAHLSKPVEPGKLVSAVGRLVQRPATVSGNR
jgi:PAS domain S-box-containing protein